MAVKTATRKLVHHASLVLPANACNTDARGMRHSSQTAVVARLLTRIFNGVLSHGVARSNVNHDMRLRMTVATKRSPQSTQNWSRTPPSMLVQYLTLRHGNRSCVGQHIWFHRLGTSVARIEQPGIWWSVAKNKAVCIAGVERITTTTTTSTMTRLVFAA